MTRAGLDRACDCNFNYPYASEDCPHLFVGEEDPLLEQVEAFLGNLDLHQGQYYQAARRDRLLRSVRAALAAHPSEQSAGGEE